MHDQRVGYPVEDAKHKRQTGGLVGQLQPVARVQVVTRVLREAMDLGSIPPVPVHVDSPMAVDVSKIYAMHHLSWKACIRFLCIVIILPLAIMSRLS